jgi:hypothetical protein
METPQTAWAGTSLGSLGEYWDVWMMLEEDNPKHR